MFYICIKFCESTSKDFRHTDLNSRVNAKVVANYISIRSCESIWKGFRVTDLNSRVNNRMVANVDARWTDIWTNA